MSFTGAGNTLAVVRQASPIITALMLSGVAGSAICSDIGARKIREERPTAITDRVVHRFRWLSGDASADNDRFPRSTGETDRSKPCTLTVLL